MVLDLLAAYLALQGQPLRLTCDLIVNGLRDIGTPYQVLAALTKLVAAGRYPSATPCVTDVVEWLMGLGLSNEAQKATVCANQIRAAQALRSQRACPLGGQ